MKAITLWAPWAAWIAQGRKTIEVRRHNRFASLAGKRVAIHQGRKLDPDVCAIAGPWWSPEVEDLSSRFKAGMPTGLEAVRGRVLCIAHVDEVRPVTSTDSPNALCDCSGSGLYGLILSHVRILAERPEVPGHQGIWDWTPPAGICRVCGCSQWDACFDDETDVGCSWAEANLCSVCAAKER